MSDLLISAAKRFGVPTDSSMEPDEDNPNISAWARWPRHPYEIAQDVLNEVLRTEVEAMVAPLSGTPLWRARHGAWTHIGRFEEAVAHLASYCVEQRVPEIPTLAAADVEGRHMRAHRGTLVEPTR